MLKVTEVPTAPVHNRLLIIDDDPKLVSLLARGLTFEGFEVLTATDGPEGLAAVTKAPPQVVILDVAMPGMDGFEVCRRLRATHDVPIIMLTARDDVADIVTGLNLGADDYLGKPFAFEELLARIGAALRRSGTASIPLTYADISLNPVTREVHRGTRPIELTPTEFGILLTLLRHPRQVLTRPQLMAAVWEGEAPEPGVLDVHIGNLRAKLEADGEPRLVTTVRGVGYVLRR
jgi:two-component system, OmpR family, response regulator MprA